MIAFCAPKKDRNGRFDTADAHVTGCKSMRPTDRRWCGRDPLDSQRLQVGGYTQQVWKFAETSELRVPNTLRGGVRITGDHHVDANTRTIRPA